VNVRPQLFADTFLSLFLRFASDNDRASVPNSAIQRSPQVRTFCPVLLQLSSEIDDAGSVQVMYMSHAAAFSPSLSSRSASGARRDIALKMASSATIVSRSIGWLREQLRQKGSEATGADEPAFGDQPSRRSGVPVGVPVTGQNRPVRDPTPPNYSFRKRRQIIVFRPVCGSLFVLVRIPKLDVAGSIPVSRSNLRS